MSKSIRSLGEEREGAQVSNLKIRLANLLDEIVENEGQDLGDGWFRLRRKLSQVAIGKLIGGAPSTTRAYFSGLKNEGLIRDSGGRHEIYKKGARAFLVRSEK